MRFRIAEAESYPAGLDLPWATPLEQWPDEPCTGVERGLHRNPLRFVSHQGSIYAIKELLEHVAKREYSMLRALREMNLPVVEPVGLVTDRPVSEGHDGKGLVVTRFLQHSMPFRNVISRGVSGLQASQLLDAGRYSAYLVDAETGEMHAALSSGLRRHDLAIAEENVAGEFMDLEAGFGLPEDLDPIELYAALVARYESLWTELTREEIFAAQEQYRIDSRIRRLNELGFDVEELDIQTIDRGHRIRLRVQVVEPGHHRRRLQALTGLDVQENQARRLLNDLDHYRAWQSGLAGRAIPEAEAARHWLEDVYRPALAAIPAGQSARLDGAEIFHQLLEHRWYMSERAGHDLPLERVIPSYVADVLSGLPAPEVAG